METVSSSTALDVLVISWSCWVAPACISSASDENVVGAGSDFHGRFANALENFGEVVEHVVDGVRDVAERVAGDFFRAASNRRGPPG